MHGMEQEAVGTPWGLLVGGLLTLGYGLAQWRGAGWIGAALSARERRHSSRLLCAVGASWLFVFWSATWPFYNQLKPYAVVILATALWPLATLAFTGWFLYFAVVRLFRK